MEKMIHVTEPKDLGRRVCYCQCSKKRFLYARGL